jgi:hypothetical protein
MKARQKLTQSTAAAGGESGPTVQYRVYYNIYGTDRTATTQRNEPKERYILVPVPGTAAGIDAAMHSHTVLVLVQHCTALSHHGLSHTSLASPYHTIHKRCLSWMKQGHHQPDHAFGITTTNTGVRWQVGGTPSAASPHTVPQQCTVGWMACMIFHAYPPIGMTHKTYSTYFLWGRTTNDIISGPFLPLDNLTNIITVLLVHDTQRM